MPRKKHVKSEWLERSVAMTAAVLSVLLALTTIFGGIADGNSTQYLVQSTDQWAFYQAKSIKGNLYDADRLMLETEKNNTANTASYNSALDVRISDFKSKVDTYNKEKADIQTEAQRLEKLSASEGNKASVYNYANAFYQIAIILSAIALLIKKKYMWLAGVVLGLIGIGFSVFAYCMV